MNELKPLPADDGNVDLAPPAAEESPSGFNRMWWQIGILLLVSAVMVYTGSAFDDELKKYVPEGRQLASTYNKKATGLMALSRLAEASGQKVIAWESPYRHLDTEEGILVLIAPTESLAPFQIDQILAWVKKGNQLVYIDDLTFDLTSYLANRLGVTIKVISKEMRKPSDKDIQPQADIPELAFVDKMRLSSNVRVQGGKPIVADDKGNFLTAVDCGNGRVLFGTCPAMVANKIIQKKEYWGNFQMMANWFNTTNGTIYFDEYAHGFTGGTNVFAYIAQSPAGFAIAQLGLILVIAFFSELQRFGMPLTVDSRRQISNLEFIYGLSNAYRRARANAAVLEILFHAFKNKLCRALAVSPHEPTERLQEAWQMSKFNSKYDLEGLLKQYEECISRREVSDAELKTMILTCDKITEASQGSSSATNYRS
ncbi:MAG: DUF4350 domain-containing protein [Candidatus Obscuribacterales bacterium]|nr:DUF4350 domain-containing protein [Candidatus Obscuribacterales bacterium]